MNKTHALAMVLLCLCWPSIGCVRQSPDAAPLDLTRTKQCVPDQVEESAATSSSFFVSVKYHDKNHNKIVIKDGMAVFGICITYFIFTYLPLMLGGG